MTFYGVRANVMLDNVNCAMLYGVLLGDNIDDRSIFWMGNSSGFHYILTVQESGILPFVFVICCRCY